tara:strand:- start:1987 stop:2676 length:690 start_codon:yes stop_codon:yes gene_type:complete
MIFSIIVPVYNEENTILEILTRLEKIQFTSFQKEVIVVDDGSSDNTKKILENSKNLYNKIYFNQKNQGKGSAVRNGLNKAKGEYVVIQDGDLEYNPEDLIKFEKVFLNFKADGIIGSRFSYDKYTRSHSILNKFANFLLTLFFNILYNTTFTDIYSCYFAFRKELIDTEKLKIDGFAQHAEILTHVIKKGSKFYEVPINYDGRSFSEGKKIKFYHFFPVILQILIGKFK